MEPLFVVFILAAIFFFSKMLDLLFKVLEMTLKLLIPAVIVILLLYFLWDSRNNNMAPTPEYLPRTEEPARSKKQQSVEEEIPLQRRRIKHNKPAAPKRLNVSPSRLPGKQLDDAIVKEYEDRYEVVIPK